MITVKEVIQATGGSTSLAPALVFTGVNTDSRTVKTGELFVALKGEKFDGHAYCAKALAQGAAAVLVEKITDFPAAKAIVVKDGLAAYQLIAKAYRRGKKAKVVAITGSNGKTSTKDLIAACLASKYQVIKTQANFNNEIGLPKTLLTITDTTDLAVVEMGMRGFGQIRALKQLAEPDCVVITNVGETHMELLGSMENIARAKSEILENLTAENVAVLNNDDKLVSKMSTGAKTVTYGIIKNSAVQAKDIKTDGFGTTFTYTSQLTGKNQKVNMPLIGEHNVMNALAAIAVAETYGVADSAIALALHNIVMTGKRQEISHFGAFTVINDAYNASPASMEAACKTLQKVCQAQSRGRAVAVLADMLELGAESRSAHTRVGDYVADAGVQLLIVYGQEARYIAAEAKRRGVPAFLARDKEEAAAILAREKQPGDVILLKGSHSMAVDKVLELVFKREGK